MNNDSGTSTSPATSRRPRSGSTSSSTHAELMTPSKCYVSRLVKPRPPPTGTTLSHPLATGHIQKRESVSSVAVRDLPKLKPGHRPSTSSADTHKIAVDKPSRRSRVSTSGSGLSRHGTLLTTSATPARMAAELKSILGNHQARLKSKAALTRVDLGPASSSEHVALEQAKPRARVEVDILPQTNTCVQGGYLSGRVKIYVREKTRKEDPVAITGGKIRVIGFESQGDELRSIFYQCSAMLSSVTPSLEGLYASDVDEEGFAIAREGEHDLPFALYLSLSSENGQAKGPLRGTSGASLNYIAMISLKIRDASGRRSIAHFYRACEIWPRLDPTTVLSSVLRPLQATASTSPSKNPNDGRIKLTASLHRLHWVAGQRCQVKVIVNNDTSRTLKGLTLSLHRSTTNFPYPLGSLETTTLDADLRRASVTTKQVAGSTLRMGQPGMKGYASAKGWWTGVRPGQVSEFEHMILIPIDALTISRGRLVEVEYTLRVSMDSGSRLVSDIQVILPIRIIGFPSIDPSPSHPINSRLLSSHYSRPVCSRRGTEAKTASVASPSIYSDPGKPDYAVTKNSSTRHHHTLTGVKVESVNDISKEDAGGADGSHISEGASYLQTDNSQCSDLEDGELGNLLLTDDTDEVVQHAITSARTDLTYAGFSDLYYASQNQDLNEAPGSSETDSYEHSSDASKCEHEDLILKSMPESDSRARPRPGTRRYSSFAVRVEEKTRLATAVYLSEGQLEQHTQQEPQTSEDKQHRSHRPHLSLRISPVLGGGHRNSDFRDAEKTQVCIPSTILAGFEENVHSQASPANGKHSEQRSQSGTESALTALASTPTPRSLQPMDSPLPSARALSTPPFSEGRQKSTAPGPLCCRCGGRYGESPASATVSALPPSTTGFQRQQEYSAATNSDSGASSDPSQPRVGVAGQRALVDYRGASNASVNDIPTPASAVSTASRVSTVSFESISVKDKVRELEERVKAAALA